MAKVPTNPSQPHLPIFPAPVQLLSQYRTSFQSDAHPTKNAHSTTKASPTKSIPIDTLRIPAGVLTNPQSWITHPLPLSGLTCVQPEIAASLGVPWDSFSYSSNCSDRIFKCQRDGEEIETSTCIIFMRFFFLSPWILSSKSQWWKCEQLNFKQHIQSSCKSNG